MDTPTQIETSTPFIRGQRNLIGVAGPPWSLINPTLLFRYITSIESESKSARVLITWQLQRELIKAKVFTKWQNGSVSSRSREKSLK